MDAATGHVKAALDGLLADVRASGAAPSAALVEKIVELAKLAYATASPAEWEALSVQVRESLGIDEDELSARVGGEHNVGLDVDVPTDYESFEPLVTDGWMRDYLDYTADTEAPAQYHFGSAITCAAACLGRKPHIGWRVMDTYPNMYTLLVGPSGARKSSGIQMASNLFMSAMPEGVFNRLPEEGSPQGYAKWLRKRQYTTSKAADGLIVASELTVTLGKGKYQEELGKWLTDWYDSPAIWRRALVSDEYMEVFNLYVNFLGASNMTWLRELPQSIVRGGLLPRTLILDAAGKRHRKAQPKFDTLLGQKLKSELAIRLCDVSEEMALAPETERLMGAWYLGPLAQQEERASDEMFQRWVDRKQACALKIAATWQYLDGKSKSVLLPEYFDRARRVVDWADASVRRVYSALGVTDAGETQAAIVDLLSRAPKNEMAQSKIVRALRNKWAAGRVLDALKTLQMSREVKSTSDPVKGAAWTLVRR